MGFISAFSEDARSLYYIFTLLLPATLYAMGLMEGRKGRLFFILGLTLHGFTILLRAMELGTLPLTEKHDNISFMALSSALIYWFMLRDRRSNIIDLTALPLVSILLCVAAAYEPINTIPPIQRSLWFYLHMLFYFVSYGFFGVSACIGLQHLFTGETVHEIMQYKVAAYGWVAFTFSLICGSIWFFVAYGTYWLWTSRELWTALAWFWYGLYLHARLMKGLRGRPAAVLGVLGFAVVLFTYFGVGKIIPSPPTQF
jgi:ABC-type transport system involved in cytochrome c biogenesis permease subunit